MDLDNRISFIGGFIFTSMMTISLNDILMTSILGLIGGFFGLAGKELFYQLRKLWRKE